MIEPNTAHEIDPKNNSKITPLMLAWSTASDEEQLNLALTLLTKYHDVGGDCKFKIETQDDKRYEISVKEIK